MRKIISTMALVNILVLLLVGQGWGATLSNKNTLSKFYYGGDSSYLYGISGNTQIIRRDSSGNETNGANLSTYTQVLRIYVTSTDGLIFAEAYNSSAQYFLLKSVDGGANFGDNSPSFDNGNPVLEIGLDDGTHTSNVSLLSASNFCEATISGSRVLLVGEYNVNASRIDGSTNDRIRLMKSSDDGTTWLEVITWNNDGSNNNIRHFHCVRQDPYSRDIYMTFGDTNVQSMILRWNGTTDISSFSNHSPAWYGSSAGNITYSINGLSAGVCVGEQRYRGGYLLFDASYVYHGIDSCYDDSQRGIQRVSKDLSSSTIIDNSVVARAGHAMFSAFKSGDGTMYFVEYLESTATDLRCHVYDLTNGLVIDRGTVGLKDTAGPTAIFEWKGDIYLPTVRLAGGFTGDGGGTLVLSVGSSYLETDPVILSPVYYVNKSGSDTNDGRSLTTAWLTYGRAVTGAVAGADEICRGGLVKIAAGTYDEGSTSLISDYDTYAATTGDTVFKGAGREITIITGSMSTLTQFNPEETNTQLRDMTFYTTSSTVFNIQASTVLKIHKCNIGTPTSTCAAARLYGTLYLDDSKCISTPNYGSNVYGISYYGAGSLVMTKSTIDGFSHQVYYQNGGISLTAYNCIFINFKTRGVWYAGSVSSVPIIKNCIFKKYPGSSGISIDDDCLLTETDAEIDYNCFGDSVPPTDITNNGGSHSLYADPRFISSSDLRLRADSPCINAGTDVGLTSDFRGRKVPQGTAPDIGAYEYYPRRKFVQDLLMMGGN